MERTDKILWALAAAALLAVVVPLIQCSRKSAIDYGPTGRGGRLRLDSMHVKALVERSDGNIRLLTNDGSGLYEPKTNFTKRTWQLPSDDMVWETSHSGTALIQMGGKIIVQDPMGNELSRLAFERENTPVFRTLSPNGKYYGYAYGDLFYSVRLTENSEEVRSGRLDGAWLKIANDGTLLVAHKGGTVIRPDGTSFPLQVAKVSEQGLTDDGKYVVRTSSSRVSLIRVSDEKEVFTRSFERGPTGFTTRGNMLFVYGERHIPQIFHSSSQTYGWVINLRTLKQQGKEIRDSAYGGMTPLLSEDGRWLVLSDAQIEVARLINVDSGDSRRLFYNSSDFSVHSPSMVITSSAIYIANGSEFARFNLP